LSSPIAVLTEQGKATVPGPCCALERLAMLIGRVGAVVPLALTLRLLGVVGKVIDTLCAGRGGDTAAVALATLCRCTGNLCCLFTHSSGMRRQCAVFVMRVWFVGILQLVFRCS
jgi:hypothetical protein